MRKQQRTRKFTCWVLGRREETEEMIEAVDGWDARYITAEKHGVSITETGARRIPEEGKRKGGG